MSQRVKDKKIRESLSSILLGYSVVMLNGQKVFIKHHGYCDLIETDFQYDQAFDSCIKQGIYTEQQKLDLAIQQGAWSNDEDIRINFLIENIKKLRSQESKNPIPSQRKKISDEIIIKESELKSLNEKRFSLLGVTAEVIANKRSEDFYIFKSFYRDASFLNPLNKDEEFDIIDDDYMESMRSCYFDSLDFILNENIRYIALSDVFMSLLYLSENSYEVLGKPFAQYTFYQKDLISYGIMYKRILTSEPLPPDSIKDDPDKLEEWVSRSNSSKKLTETKSSNLENSGKMIFDATNEDIKEIFGDEEVVNVGTEIKKRGGMKMQDFMKLHGVI